VANRIVGIDIGQYSVKAVIIETGLRSWELVSCEEEVIARDVEDVTDDAVLEPDDDATPVPGGDESNLEGEEIEPDQTFFDAETLRAILALKERGALDGDAWIVAIRRDDAYLTPLTLPFGTPKEVQAVLLPQLDGRIPVEADEMFIDATVGGPADNGGFLIHTAALDADVLEKMLDELAAVGIDPRIVDVQPWNLTGALRAAGQAGAGPVALLDIGALKSAIVVATSERLEFSRVITGGGDALTHALADEFKLSAQRAREGKHREGAILPPLAPGAVAPDDTVAVSETLRRALRGLLRSVRSTLLSHSTSFTRPVERMFIVGSTARIDGLPELLSDELGIPCERLSISPSGPAAAAFETSAVTFSTALSLALRGTQQAAVSQFNLRRGRFAFRGSYEFVQSQLPALLSAAAVFLFCLGALYAGRMMLLRSEAGKLDDALVELTTQTFDEELTSVGEIRRRLTAVSTTPRLHPEKSAFWFFVEIANMVADLQDVGTTIEARELDIDLGRFTFVVQGVGESAQAVDDLMEELASVACLTDITRNDLSAGSADLLTFRVQGKIDCVANPEGRRRGAGPEADDSEESE
jgi:general secretion pathway protein L